MRARLALAVSEQTCELREIVLRSKPAAMLAASPKGTVPVLITCEEKVIEQSLDIMLWALRQNDPQSWLSPSVGSLNDSQALIDACEQIFKFHLDRYKYPQRYALENGLSHRDAAADWLMDIERLLSHTLYLSGTHRGLADMAILPFVRQYAHTDFAWFESQAWPRVRQWLENWKASDLFDRVMKKYEPWEEGQAITLFP